MQVYCDTIGRGDLRDTPDKYFSGRRDSYTVSVTDTNADVNVIYQLVSVKEIPLYDGPLNCHTIS